MKYIKLKVWQTNDEYEDVIFVLQYAKMEELFLGFEIELSNKGQDVEYVIPVRTKDDADDIMNRILREDNIDLNLRAYDARKSVYEELCNEMIEYNSRCSSNAGNIENREGDLKTVTGFSAVDED